MSFLDPRQYLINAGLLACMLVMRVLIAPRQYSKSFDLLMILGMLYPFGEMLQSIREVPAFIRWHLSDAGVIFNVMTACAMAYVIGLVTAARARKIGHAICLYFFLMEFTDILGSAMGFTSLTRGDPIDALSMAVAYGISLHLVKKIEMEREVIAREQAQSLKRAFRKERKLRFKVGA